MPDQITIMSSNSDSSANSSPVDYQPPPTIEDERLLIKEMQVKNSQVSRMMPRRLSLDRFKDLSFRKNVDQQEDLLRPTSRSNRVPFQRRFSIDRLSTVKFPKVDAAIMRQDNIKPSLMLTDTMFEAMLSESEPRKSRRSRRTTMDLIHNLASESTIVEASSAEKFSTKQRRHSAIIRTNSFLQKGATARRASMDLSIFERAEAANIEPLQTRRISLDLVQATFAESTSSRDLIFSEDFGGRPESSKEENVIPADEASFSPVSQNGKRRNFVELAQNLNISSEELTMIDGIVIDENVGNDSCDKELSSCSTAKDASLDSNFFLGSDKGDTIHKDISPNTPHPSIEYPPLYFAIKRYPKILNAMYYLYRVRWELQYPLQRRVPFSKKLRKIGITCTWGELLLWAPFTIIAIQGIMTSFVHPSVANSGVVSRLPLIVCFLTANHNSLLTLLMGIPFERAIKYHKVSGYLAFVNGIFHTIVAYIAYKEDAGKDQEIIKFVSDGQVNISGSLLLGIILSMVITASPYIRGKAFEVFYYFHIFFAMAMMGCAFYHSGILVPLLASILWGGDVLIRKVYMACFRYPTSAQIKQLTDTVVEVKFPKTAGFDYNPGQYVKIAIPKLSVFQWHPISISSSPHQHYVTLHIRKRGAWTTRLHELAGKRTEVTILLEGPYGSLGVDLTSDRYKMVMLLSGGIGVTPMQSIAHQLTYEHEWGDRELKKLWFVWTARDPQVMSNMDVVNNHRMSTSQSIAIDSTQVGIDSLNKSLATVSSSSSSSAASEVGSLLQVVSENILTAVPPCLTTDEELEHDLPLEDFEETDEEESEDEFADSVGDTDAYVQDFNADIESGGSKTRLQRTDSSVKSNSTDEVLDLACYLTAKEKAETGLGDLPFINEGRPDMKEIFLAMREEAIQQGEKRVAICVCAPLRLVTITRMACVKFSNRHVRFDFHSEVFD